jgi:hypothetical protein
MSHVATMEKCAWMAFALYNGQMTKHAQLTQLHTVHHNSVVKDVQIHAKIIRWKLASTVQQLWTSMTAPVIGAPLKKVWRILMLFA